MKKVTIHDEFPESDGVDYKDLVSLLDEEDESVFSNNPDWYLRMQEDEGDGWADYS